MHDAKHCREQAAFCLELARQIADRQTSLDLKATAARYRAQADEMERQADPEGRRMRPPDYVRRPT